MKKIFTGLFAVLLLLASFQTCPATTLTIQTANNMFMMISLNDTNYSSNDSINLGYNGTYTGRAVGIFDFTVLPAGSIISSATLSMSYYIYNGSNPVGKTLTVDRVLRTDVNLAQFAWVSYKTGASWGTAGAANTSTDITTTGEATTLVPASYGWTSFDVTTMAQYAQANTGKIIYLRVTGDNSSGYTSSYYSSYYSTDTSLRPKLTITYTVPSSGWTGTVMGVTNPATVIVSVANIKTVMGK